MAMSRLLAFTVEDLARKYAQARMLLLAEGFTLSPGCYCDLARGEAYVCSNETAGPDTYGHPRREVCMRIGAGDRRR